MDTLKETIPFIENNLERYGLIWVNTDRKADDWKLKIYESQQSGKQIGVYLRKSTLIRLETYDSAIAGVTVRSGGCPQSSAANAAFSRFKGGLGVCVEVEDRHALEKLLNMYFGNIDAPIEQGPRGFPLPDNKGLPYYEALFAQLNVNKSKGHSSPHKMCLLLSVIGLIEDGVIQDNRIYFDDKLTHRFTEVFNQYRSHKDRDNPHLPFFHLRSESFWHHHLKPGAADSYEALTTASGPGVIDRHIAYACLDESLFELLKNQFVRDYLSSTLESTLNEDERRDLLSPGKGWDWLECEVTVQSYFAMLDKELRGEKYNKTTFRHNLQPLLKERSDASIEFKHQNISAILVELGYPYISGYKPAYNYQQQLKEAVEVYLVDKYKYITEEAESFIESTIAESPVIDWDAIIEDVPELGEFPEEKASGEFNPRKFNFAERESTNRKLGEAGESFVLDYERYRMEKAGRSDLVDEVEWTSKEKGDGAGYDIRSFNPDRDEELFIEVKTTKSGKYQPFYISENEVAFSDRYPEQYSLYRVFQFKVSPKIFTLTGKLSDHVHLIPKSYRATF